MTNQTSPAPLLSAAELTPGERAILEELRELRRAQARPRRDSLSLADAATILGIDRVRTLPALISAGTVRAVKIAGHTRIAREEVERVLREGASLEAPAPRARRRRAGERQSKAEVLAAIRAIRVEDL